MTVLKLRSDWHVQIPVQVVNWTKLFAQSHQTLFPPRRWGLGTRLIFRRILFGNIVIDVYIVIAITYNFLVIESV